MNLSSSNSNTNTKSIVLAPTESLNPNELCLNYQVDYTVVKFSFHFKINNRKFHNRSNNKMSSSSSIPFRILCSRVSRILLLSNSILKIFKSPNLMRVTMIYWNDKKKIRTLVEQIEMRAGGGKKRTKRGNKKCQVFRIRKKTRRFEKTEIEKMRKARIWRWWRCLCRTISTMLAVVSGCFEVTDISLYISQSISQFPRNSLSAVCFTFNREQPLKPPPTHARLRSR